MALREKDLACGRFYESRAYTSNVTGIFSPNEITCRLSHVIGALKVCAHGANGAEVKKVGFLYAVADSVAAPC
jgi:hypothetical protein